MATYNFAFIKFLYYIHSFMYTPLGFYICFR